MGLFDKAPYSLKNLIKGTLAARANGEPYSGYKYAIAFQEEDDERFGPRHQTPTVESRIADSLSEDAIRDVAERAIAKWHTQKGRDLQYLDEDCRVEVKSGYHRDTKQIATDIVIHDRKDKKGLHLHLVLDDSGRVLHERWKTNKP